MDESLEFGSSGDPAIQVSKGQKVSHHSFQSGGNVDQIALALGKPVILITRGSEEEVPFDFRHYCFIRYEENRPGHAMLARELQKLLHELTASGLTDARILRQMLLPASLNNRIDRSIVAASPLSFREARRMQGGFSALRQTSSDHVGVRGLLRAFGLLEGLNNFPELLNPGDYRDDALKNSREAFDLYCIGSPKANRWSGLLLEELQQRWTPAISFVPDVDSPDLRDVRVVVRRDNEKLIPPDYRDVPRPEWDFGIVIRAPNPYHPNRLAMILAGRSALGSQAACAAATDPKHVRTLCDALTSGKVDLDDHHQPFLAVVHMEADPKNHHQAIPESLAVSFVERLKPRN